MVSIVPIVEITMGELSNRETNVTRVWSDNISYASLNPLDYKIHSHGDRFYSRGLGKYYENRYHFIEWMTFIGGYI